MRGASRVTIVSIVAMLIFLVSTHYCFSQDLNFGEGINVPVFETAKDLWGGPQQVDMNDIPTQMVSFGTNRPITEVLDFYKQKMPALGWELGHVWEGLNVVYFTKGQYFLYVAASGVLRGYAPSFTKFAIVLSRREIHLCATANLIYGPAFEETPGRDLPFIPRYPGSIRVASFIREEKEGFFVYVSTDSAKKIAAYYRKKLPNFGWRPSEDFVVPRSCVQESFSASVRQYFRGNKDSLTIYVSYCEQSRANIIVISYNYAFNYAIWPLAMDQTW